MPLSFFSLMFLRNYDLISNCFNLRTFYFDGFLILCLINILGAKLPFRYGHF